MGLDQPWQNVGQGAQHARARIFRASMRRSSWNSWLSLLLLLVFLAVAWGHEDVSAQADRRDAGQNIGLAEASGGRRKLSWKLLDVIEPTGLPEHDVKQNEEITKILTGEDENLPNFKYLGPARLAIFTAPRPFTEGEKDPQVLAIKSWLRLKPEASVYLLGNHPSFHVVAAMLGPRVSVDPRVDCNFLGIPLFNSMVARAQAARQPYSMIISSEVVILNDVIMSLHITRKNFAHFVMMAAQAEVARVPLSLLDPPGANSTFDEIAVRAYSMKHGKRVLHAKVGFWVWNNSPIPLLNATMPPFVYQRGKHDYWLAHEVAAAGYRSLVDATDLVTCISLKQARAEGGLPHEQWDSAFSLQDAAKDLTPVYAYRTPPGRRASSKRSPPPGAIRLRKWNLPRPNNEEILLNRRLAQLHLTESLGSRKGKVVTAWKLARCTRNGKRVFCIKNIKCSLVQGEGASGSSASEPASWLCNHVTLKPPPKAVERVTNNREAELTYNNLHDLLPIVGGADKTLTLVAVSRLYKDMLMSFICMLRRLELPNPLVAALDPEIYAFAEEQGLAVFYDQAARQVHLEQARSGNQCKFGTVCFKQITKLKSRIVLHVLKEGYNVLWSDVDIIWFRDPLPEFASYGPGHFAAQSDQPRVIFPANGANGTSIKGGAINSGFYYARSEVKTTQAFAAIVEDAKKTNTSEQPSFYKVLCGGMNGTTAVGTDQCVWPQNGLRTVFLPRTLHPNGKIFGYWNDNKTAQTCISNGCATLHNNWIKGKQAKINRMKEKGLWYYDPINRICLHTWYRHTRGLPLFLTNTDEEVEDQT